MIVEFRYTFSYKKVWNMNNLNLSPLELRVAAMTGNKEFAIVFVCVCVCLCVSVCVRESRLIFFDFQLHPRSDCGLNAFSESHHYFL